MVIEVLFHNKELSTFPKQVQSFSLDTSSLQRETGGRPRSVLLLLRSQTDKPSYADALKQWADQFLPELADETSAINSDLIIPLLMSAIAGPLPTKVVHNVCLNIDVIALRKYFDKGDAGQLSETMPALEPDDLAEEIANRAIRRLDAENRQVVLAAAIAANPGAVDLHLGSMWVRHSDDQLTDMDIGVTDGLLALQKSFDSLAADRVAALIQSVSDCVTSSRTPGALPNALADLEHLVARRPFDPVIRLHEATAACDAINYYGEAERWDDLERWGLRVTSITNDTRFSENLEIRIEETACAGNAIACYGKAKRWDDLERWGRRLISVAEDKRFSDSQVIRFVEVGSAASTINFYGEAFRWDDLERWGDRIRNTVSDRRFSDNPRVRLNEAKAAVNAIKFYGIANRWDDLERWGHILTVLGDDQRFSNTRVIRLQESSGAVNAITYYGGARRWDDLERWGRILNRIGDNARFSGDFNIRLQDAKGAVNAMICYSHSNRIDDVERWGRRLTSITDDAKFANYAAIRLEEARGASSAMARYGTAKLFKDLERWGRRLTGLADQAPFSGDREIRLVEAAGANNAIISYGNAQLWDDLERWGQRLTSLADDARFSGDRDIRVTEATGDVNAILIYTRQGIVKQSEIGKWRDRLARVALRFPESIVIQELAARYGLNYVNQVLPGLRNSIVPMMPNNETKSNL